MAKDEFNPVAWAEGLFLRPHHLQQQDRYTEERLRYHLASVHPFFWGVRELEINEEALSEHRIEIQKLEAVMPGGMVVRYPGNAVIEAREFDPTQQRFDVHVALRRPNPSEPSALPAETGRRDVRYLVEAHDLPDTSQGGANAPVELAHPNLRLFLDADDPELEVHESFKLAEVVATGDLAQSFALSPTYCPPLTALQGAPALCNEVERVVAQMAAKVRTVAGRTKSVARAEFQLMWVQFTLARMAPLMRHLLSTGETSPFDAYTALVDTAGSLSAFNHGEAVDVPTYDHRNLHACFSTLIGFIDAELGLSVRDRSKMVPLPYDAQSDSYATSQLNTDLVSPNNRYYLGVKASMDAKELSERVVSEGKAGSARRVKAYMAAAVQGLRIEHLAAAPTDVSPAAGFEYFKVDPHSSKWDFVKKEFTFALHVPKLESAEVQLFVVTSES